MGRKVDRLMARVSALEEAFTQLLSDSLRHAPARKPKAKKARKAAPKKKKAARPAAAATVKPPKPAPVSPAATEPHRATAAPATR